MEIIQAIFSSIIDHTIAPLKRHMGYAFCYKSNVEDLRTRVEKLKDDKESLENSAAEATRRGEEVEKRVENWFVRVAEATGEADSLLMNGEEQAKNRCFIGLCPNLKAQYELGRGAAKKALAIVHLQDEANKLGRISYRPPPQQIVPSSMIGREGLPSRLFILKEVMDLLKHSDLNIIGVFGMGGVGKTTLVQEVHRLAKEEKLFDVVVMTDVSQTPEIRKIQGLIADAVGLKFDEDANSVRAWRLQQRLMKERSILIILDNIWGRLELDEIGIPSGNNHKGCKILLTSRNENVLIREMSAQEVRRLEFLTDEEAKSLFKINAGDGNSDLPPEAADIAEKCGGLPLLLVTIANSLKNKGPYAWKDKLFRLSRFDNQDINAKLYSILESTYDGLPGEEIKYLFLLCALLGRSDIYILDLLKYSMGLGLFKSVETVEDARNRIYTLIDELKGSCLLLDSYYDGRVKIHDIVREVAMSIASKAQQAFTVKDGIVLKEWPNKDVLGLSSKIISLPHCDISNLPERLECSEAEFLYLQTDHTWKISNSVFEGCSKLKVLYFRGTSLISLPHSLSYLTNLRTLCLDQCTLCDISAIVGLKKLEILSLVSSNIVELPREVEQLTQLRILDLSNCRKLKFIPANVISRLSMLEELYMGSFVEWDVEGHRTASLVELESLCRLTTLQLKILDATILPRGLFSKNLRLERFWIDIGDMMDWHEEYRISRVLKLQLDMDMLEDSVKLLLNQTQELRLINCKGFNNFVCDLDSGGFPSLKHLSVEDDDDIQYIIESLTRVPDCNAFPSLETLRLLNLTSLEKICSGRVASGPFSKLREVDVSECHELKHLFSISLFKGTLQLQKMNVSACDNMEEIIVDDEFHDRDNANHRVEFTQLRSLELRALPELRTFFSKSTRTKQKLLTDEPTSSQEALSADDTPMALFNEMVHFPNLENLTLSSITCKKIWCDQPSTTFSSLTSLIIEQCKNLMYLFSYSVAKSLLQLKELHISDCDFMEVIGRHNDKLEEDQGMDVKILFRELNSLTLTHLPNVTRFCDGYPIEFHSLSFLLVKSCSSLTSIITNCPSEATISNKGAKAMNLTKNQHIEFHSLFDKVLFKKLTVLHVVSCSNVKEVFNLKGAIRGDEGLVGLMSSLSGLCLYDLPRLLYVCNLDLQGILDFNSLKLLNAFTPSMASRLEQLREIEIRSCPGLRGFVQMGGADDAAVDHRIFYALKEITISNCPRMRMFISSLPKESEPIIDDKAQMLKKNEVDRSISLPINPELFPNLEKLSLDGMTAMMMMMNPQRPLPITFGCQVNLLEIDSYRGRSLNFLQRLQNLKEIVVRYSSLKEIFTSGGVRDDKKDAKWTLSIKKLELIQIRDLKHVWKEDSPLDQVLPNLETLKVSSCENLVSIAPPSSSFRNLTILEVVNCGSLINLVSAATAKSLVQLVTVRILDCSKLLEIIADGQHGSAQEQEEIIFSKLKTLELVRLNSLTRVCSWNYAFTFPSLELVYVEGCPKLRTFCFGLLKTPMLESVQVTNESNDKKKYWEGNLNATIQQLYSEMEMVPTNEETKLSDLPHLNEEYNAPNHLKILKRFSHLYKLVVDKCAFGSNAVTSHALQPLKSLKVLVVEKCDSAIQLIDFEDLSPDGGLVGLMSQLHELHLINLPRLSAIWNNDARGIQCFRNLKVLKVHYCSSLTNIFTLSMALGLVRLKEIDLRSCNSVEAIVMKDEEKQQPTSDKTIIFPSLESITLEHLASLTSIYSGREVLEFPSLKKIDVFQCPKMLVHASESSWEREHNETICMDNSNVPAVSSFCGKMFPNLEELSLHEKAIMMIAQSSLLTEMISSKLRLLILHSIQSKSLGFLGRSFGSLNKLCVENCFLEELFRYEGGGRVNGGDTLPLIIKNLELNDIDGLKHLCNQDSQLNLVVLKHLETLTVEGCYDLVNLAPSSSCVSFQNLTTLQVSNCDGIIYLLPSSVAKSMVQLVTMIIVECDKLTRIVADEQQDSTVREEGEIVFSKLETLEFINLKSLTSFCSDECTFTFPSLEEVVLQACPKLKIFSVGILRTPKLVSISVYEDDDDDSGKSRWEGNLNATMQQLYADMVGFHGFFQLKLSEFPHLKETWHSQVQFKSLRKLKELVVDNCALFSSALSSYHMQYLNSLSKLSVEKCDSLEQIIDFRGIDPDESQLVLTSMSKLNELRLIDLPKLRHIWNNNSHEILGFQNLVSLIIHNCSSLTNILTVSIALDLLQLQEIEIKRCDSVQEIISREGEEEATGTDIIFPALKSITLESLPNLSRFYAGSGTISCPFLRKVDVVECPKLEMFSSEISREQNCSMVVERKKRRLCKIDFGSFFFCDKVVITSLEELRVEWNVFMNETWHVMQPHQFLSELKVIELTNIPVDWNYLPADFLQKLPYLEKLVLSDSFLEEIFPCDSNIYEEKHPKSIVDLQELKLSELPKLKHLVKTQTVPIFENLTTLEVWKCDALVNLMTPSTARSLVHLVRMSVHECETIGEIIGSEGDRAEDEISFDQLKHLGLHSLPCLTSFHSGNHALTFPSLETMIVRECPQMQTFSQVVSTPKIWQIQIEDGYAWEGNINDTIHLKRPGS